MSAVTTLSALALRMTMVNPGFLQFFSSILYMLNNSEYLIRDDDITVLTTMHIGNMFLKTPDFFFPDCEEFTKVVSLLGSNESDLAERKG